jgi:gluconolactonase
VGSENFGFIEGPVWLAEQGVLLFSDMDFSTSNNPNGPSARIRRLKPPATFDVFVQMANSNGLALDNDGAVLGASHDIQALSRFDVGTGTRTPIAVRVDGKHFNSPNDLTVHESGTVFFTDPRWQLGPRTSETNRTGVYRVDPPLKQSGDNAATLIEGMLDNPNGVALSPDQRTLYVGSGGKEIWKYAIADDGSVGARSMFVADVGNSDGMAVDCAGNLYVASGTVEVFAPSGMKLGDITLNDTPSNAAFGGSDKKTLYITAGSHLYAIKLAVPGFPY